ncbi:hypothetical protein Emed_006840 [Eimeria media]
MLAIYRCQDLKQQALMAAASEAAALQQQHPKPTAADAAPIKKELTAIAEAALEQYLSHATRYQEKICHSVKDELIESSVFGAAAAVAVLLLLLLLLLTKFSCTLLLLLLSTKLVSNLLHLLGCCCWSIAAAAVGRAAAGVEQGAATSAAVAVMDVADDAFVRSVAEAKERIVRRRKDALRYPAAAAAAAEAATTAAATAAAAAALDLPLRMCVLQGDVHRRPQKPNCAGTFGAAAGPAAVATTAAATTVALHASASAAAAADVAQMSGEQRVDAWSAFRSRRSEEMHREVETLREMQEKALDDAIGKKQQHNWQQRQQQQQHHQQQQHNSCSNTSTAAAATAAAPAQQQQQPQQHSSSKSLKAAFSHAFLWFFSQLSRLLHFGKRAGAEQQQTQPFARPTSLLQLVASKETPQRRRQQQQQQKSQQEQQLQVFCDNLSLSGLIAALREVQLEHLSLSSPTLQASGEGDKEGEKGDGESGDESIPSSFFKPLIDALSEQTIQRKAVSVMQQQCREAQLLQQRCGTGVSWRSVPLWGWLLLLCLGWNELAAVISFASSSWLLLPMLLMLLLLGGGVVVSGRLDTVLQGTSHLTQLIKLLLQPFLFGLLRRLTEMVDPSGLAGRGGFQAAAAAETAYLKKPPRAAAEAATEKKETVSD